MFERFSAELGDRRDGPGGGAPWLTQRLLAANGYDRFAEEYGGESFGRGLYRIHDRHSGPPALAAVREAFPEFAERVCPFGYDWLGRHFALDAGRSAGGEPLVLLLEPGTGEALEVPATFEGLHDEELIDYGDAALATEFFDEWAQRNPESIPLDRGSCVGYRIPLFLGGEDVVDNLEVSDLDVYWSICGQLRQSTRSLPPGTIIGEVEGPPDR